MRSIAQRLADELHITEHQVNSTIGLLDDGSTVPFIARYRKEVTLGLDDTQLRNLAERLTYLRDLDERRATILKTIDEQGKLTPELRVALEAAETKTLIEDLYLPYKKKRRTKAQIAREAGLEPLADELLANPELNPETQALSYVNAEKNITDSTAALEGARQILMERFAEDATLLGQLRDYLWDRGILLSTVVKGKDKEGIKFSDYFDFSEGIKKIPSHRALAMLRGQNESFLKLALVLENEEKLDPHPCQMKIAGHFHIKNQNRAADAWLLETVRWAWKVKIFVSLELELMNRLREQSETGAIDVFAHNLRDLLLAAPAGAKTTLGLDPGLRTGVKLAVVDDTGKLVDTATIYPHVPKNQWDQSITILAHFCEKHTVKLISIGNGTGSRETDRLVLDLMKKHPQLALTKITVSEAGASVYSASELAALEFPDLDVSIRGAVSIARRLQDPLAELVKIDPKSIGVGQYQHDVNQASLAHKLDTVVEDCVNAVGVDVNMASAPLLARVAGLNVGLAENIVAYRDAQGKFQNRQQILKVPRLGPKAFEQAGGFLRIVNGDNPLDNSAVHPETYPIVERIVNHTTRKVHTIIGDANFLRTLDPKVFIDATFGLPTVCDIIKELEKPGRDPRPEFKAPSFIEGVESMSDLRVDMILEGVVTNVANFGAFVDIGVHQDGLIHISMLSDKFIKDPREVVKTGDLVKVKVLAVDLDRKRISLTARLTDDSRDYQENKSPDMRDSKSEPFKGKKANPTSQKKSGSNNKAGKQQAHVQSNSAMSDALAQALKKN